MKKRKSGKSVIGKVKERENKEKGSNKGKRKIGKRKKKAHKELKKVDYLAFHS